MEETELKRNGILWETQFFLYIGFDVILWLDLSWVLSGCYSLIFL